MQESLTTVFIYGSLLPGHSNHHVAADYIRGSQPGVILGRLVDCGPYPALLRDDESRECCKVVRGLWVDVNELGLKRMDELEQFLGIEEDNDYDRIWVRDVESPDKCGWVYVWDSPRGCPAIDEPYWPDYFARKVGQS
ncbi:gamma-glutamylcyclotransferase family protein [Paenibacillus albus]|uniref:Gamma-glutamylcyclotransferase n=1 Tax=Paenibacillus albus TaxID=2495582 RepID=A0A3Q8X8M3_9BACL|nr:gamma-glutamylcyclotransferase family protein [Paenibacillus albus]AZN42863.1 gamma-glutamylcyclotransferase [Paenibacillus albus]